MEGLRLSGSRKGFGTMMLLVLGAVFFLIMSSIAYYMTSENDQAARNARLKSSENRLNFIAYSMQSDFNNVFLQGAFEKLIIDFLQKDRHVVDPGKTFAENFKGPLEEHMGEQSRNFISGAAAEVYSEAYSKIPQTSCTSFEVRGGGGSVTLSETADKRLRVDSWIIGRRVNCTDLESESSNIITLEARDYLLSTPAIAIFERAVAAISSATLALRMTEGSYTYSGRQWRLKDDMGDSAKEMVLQSWKSKLIAVALTASLSGKDGISVAPGSVEIKSGSGEEYAINDLEYICDGLVKFAEEGQTSAAQTCRPDGLNMVIGKDLPAGEKGMKLDINKASKADNKATYTFKSTFLSYSLDSKFLGNLIWSIVKPMEDEMMTGYVTYSGVTQLCNSFKGKPNDATVSGTVIKTGGPTESDIKFDFISAPQGELGGSELKNDENCDGKGDVINKNLLDILTYHGQDTPLTINIDAGKGGKGSTPNEGDINKLKKTVARNEMYTTPGQAKDVTVYGTVEVLVLGMTSQTESSAAVDPNAQTPTAKALGSGVANDAVKQKVRESVDAKDPNAVRNAVSDLLSTSSSEFSSIGNTKDAEATAKAAAAVCKSMGMRNWQSKGDLDRALAALCGIAGIFNKQSSGNVCSLAGVYSALKSGNPAAVAGALANALSQAGFKIDKNLLMTAGIANAIKTGDLESVLKAAAASVISSSGEAAKYLGAMANIAYTMKNGGDIEGAVMAALAMLGDQDMMKNFASLKYLEAAIKSGDTQAILNAASNVAKQFGFSGLSQFSSMLAEGQNIMNLVGNLDKLFDSCSAFKWDWVCLNPTVASGVCQQPGAAPPNCVLNPTGMQALPPLNVQKLCNDMVFDLGFQVDCTCIYVCTSGAATFPLTTQVSVGVNLNQIAATLNPDQYAGLFGDAGMMNYCMLDP